MSDTSGPSDEPVSAGYLGLGTLLADRYRIDAEIGRGGYSVVYRAIDQTLESVVAIKLLVPPPAVAKMARERMRREALAARGLSHPSIVTLHDFLEDAGHSFLVMEYVEGPNLAERVRERGVLAPPTAAAVARDVAGALSVAHSNGVLHRDVKPQNVLLGSDGRARLTDFGSARITDMETVTRTGGLVGTVAYTAPEVMAGHRGDARSDLYALGMLLYFALTGDLPPRPSPHLPPTPTPGGHRPRSVQSDVPDWLDDVVAGLTRTDPGLRYPTAGALLDALNNGLGDGDITAATLNYGSIEAPAGHVTVSGRCVLCGGSDLLSLGLCPECAGSTSTESRFRDGVGSGKRLLFVERPHSRRERIDTEEALRDLVDGVRLDSEIEATARGELPLARVPADVAEQAARRLRKQGLSVRVAHPARIGARVTPVFGAVLGLVIGMGMLAGLRVAPVMLLATPVYAVAMVWFAIRRQRNPLLRSEAVSSLPAASEQRARRTLVAMPDGPARRLLGDFVRMARGLYAAGTDDEVLEGPVVALLDHACEAATDLASLDQNLAILEAQRGQGTAGTWLDAITQASQTRDKLMQKLLEALAVMGRSRATSSSSPGQAADHLTSLAADLDDAVTWRLEAKHQVEAVLAGTIP
ncbi:MAG: serine/threonine-protein kinase [Gemmatimonadota bacterium]